VSKARELQPQQPNLPAKKSQEELIGEARGLTGLVREGHPQQHQIMLGVAANLEKQARLRDGETEHEPIYHDDLDVAIKTRDGRVIGTKLRRHDFRVLFSEKDTSEENVFTALKQTFPQAEAYTAYPDFFPKEWQRRRSEDGIPFTGIRIPLPQYEAFGVRAMWLEVARHTPYAEDFKTLSEDGRIEPVMFLFDSLNVQLRLEIPHGEEAINGGEAWYTTEYRSLDLPEISQTEGKLGEFLQYVFPSDAVAQISLDPAGFAIAMTEKEARAYPNFKPAKIDETIVFEENRVKKQDTFRDSEDKVYIFEKGVNEIGIITVRPEGVTMPYLYTQVKMHPGEGLPWKDLSPEIERMRRI